MIKNDKSVNATHFIVRLCYVLLALASIGLPVILYKGFYEFEILGQIKNYIIGPFFCVVPAGYTALICLDKLLINIKNDIVFDKKNVRLLRIISYACFYAGLVGLISFIIIILLDFVFETLFVLAMGELFVALIVMVVKNIFERAIELKDENDLTI